MHAELSVAPQVADIGTEMMALARELTPICRSITGDGLRETLRVLQRDIPLVIHEVPTGTPVFDWTIPKEWNIRDAYIKNEKGERVVDFQQCGLHVLNYSGPVRARMTRKELDPHLHSLPKRPESIPYKTSYYSETWGFCLSETQRDRLGAGPFEVCIDSSLKDGALSYGEIFIAGENRDEVLISTHCCHPYMANDNLSGIAVSLQLAKRLLGTRPRLSYRFLFIPGTIGSITWLARNAEKVKSVRHGLVLTCLGDDGPFTYKKSRRGNAVVDRAAAHVLKTSGACHRVIDFYPYGYDERQYCSPGFNLPVGCFSRSQHGTFSEYHTSDDNLDFISAEALAASLEKIESVLQVLEGNETCLNLKPQCEPKLGKYGLYGGTGGSRAQAFDELALLWVLNLSDGQTDLLGIAERADMDFGKIRAAATRLQSAGLMQSIR
jgi:aminopeptidase-like protein